MSGNASSQGNRQLAQSKQIGNGRAFNYQSGHAGRSSLAATVLALSLLVVLPAYAAGNSPDVDTTLQAAPPAKTEPSAEAGNGACTPEEQINGLLDKTQSSVYRVVCGTSMWFDGFFGDATYYEGSNESYGQINLGGYWDERDGFEPKTQFRARFALPNTRRRVRLIAGLGEADDVIDGSANSQFESPAEGFREVEEEDALLGLGFSPSRSRRQRQGFDFDVGVKFSTPIDPYARVSYRWNRIYSERWSVRVQERVFWQGDDGWGTSLSGDLTHIFSSNLMTRWGHFLKVSETVDGLSWVSNLTTYQSLSNRRAVSYRLYVKGETGAPVSIKDYGFEFRFRRRIFSKEWFFLELTAGVSWPRALPEESRTANLGAGVEFEMHFGNRRKPRRMSTEPPVTTDNSNDNKR